MRHAFGVYRRSIGALLRSIAEYPADFWVMAVSGILNQATTFAFLAVLFGAFDSIAGWSFHEMLILVAFMRLSGSFIAIGWDGIWSIGQFIVQGDLDYRITRPAPVVVQVGSSHIGMQSFGDFTIAAIMLIYGWIGAGIGLGPAAIGMGAVLLASAVGIQLALITSLNCVAFWMKGRMTPFAFTAVELENSVGGYPLKIYPGVVRTVLTFGLPFAFINYLPAQILTGRVDPVWTLAPPLAAAVCLAIMALVLKLGIRSYESAGH